ncbi:MAG: AIM24 family protein [Candidatus Sericytochromatia bacterium]|nr:AIM24 family protein [Candidatus Sericytochromatia bacterium]
MLYSPQNLPANDNLNRFAYSIAVKDEMFIQKGKMIAYYGALRFEAVGSGMLDILVKEAFNAPMYVHNYVVVTGAGSLIVADNCFDIASFDLADATFTIKASHCLGFTKGLRAQESTLPGYLTLVGTGTLLASSNGPVHFLEPPCRADEQAVVGWADLPSPSYCYDYAHVTNVLNAVGALSGITLSGEEKQLDFHGQGTVLIQSSEGGGGGLLQSIKSQMTGLAPDQLQDLSQSIATRLKG